MRLEKHAARMKICKMAYRHLVENLKYNSEYVDVYRRIILRLPSTKLKMRAVGHIRLVPTLVVVS
jgi:hypothetical protein